MDTGLYIAIMVALLIGSAYFSATETAFNSLNMTKIKIAAEHGDKTAELIILPEQGIGVHDAHGDADYRTDDGDEETVEIAAPEGIAEVEHLLIGIR